MSKYFEMKGLVILFCIFFVCSCRKQEYHYAEGMIYGTYYRVIYEADTDYNREIFAQMNRVNASLSMFDSSSVVSRWNRGETEEVDSLFVHMYRMAEKVYAETDGAFDITVAPLANAWGFGYKQKKFPSAEEIDSIRQWVGMDKLILTGNRLTKTQQETEIDASSIAKGLGVDLVAFYLEGKGVNNYLVDIGGEIKGKGRNSKNQVWRIGIDKPKETNGMDERELQLVLELEEGAVATSGNYRNFYVRDGKKYAHTIDPATGYPVQQDILSSSVYAPTCMEADAYATAFMVMGLEKSKKVVEANPELEACFVYKDNDTLRVWMTDGFNNWVVKK